MEFLLLGPLEVREDGRGIPVGGAKQRALLAILLLHANEVVSRDRLIDELWGERPPGTSGHSLDHQVSRLRKLLEPSELLVTRRAATSRGRAGADRLAAVRASARRRAGARTLPASARRRQRPPRALALWRGRALADSRTSRSRGPRSSASRNSGSRRDRGASRCRARPRPAQGAHRRARVADREASVSRAAAGPAHARALPLGASGGGAARLRRDAEEAGRASSGSSPGRSCSSSSRRSCGRTLRSTLERLRKPATKRRGGCSCPPPRSRSLRARPWPVSCSSAAGTQSPRAEPSLSPTRSSCSRRAAARRSGRLWPEALSPRASASARSGASRPPAS